MKLILYFQKVEPDSSAVSIRAKFFIQALHKKFKSRVKSIQILTTTKVGIAERKNNIEYVPLTAGRSDAGTPVIKRIASEFLFGTKAFFWLAWNHRNSALVISSPCYIPALFLSCAAYIFKIPYVLDIRDAYPEAYAQSGLIHESSFTYKLFARASKAMYANAATITTATEGLKSCISFSKNEVACIYNGFPLDLKAVTKQKHRNFTVCFHGVMGYFQDIETLSKLIQHPGLYGINFVAIGYGRKSKLIESIKSDNFRFLGRLSHNEAIREISKCHLGISLRIANQISYDSFPVKIWEYIGLGIPSLVFPESEAGKFLMNANCGIQLSSIDVDDLTNTILQIKSDLSMYRSMEASCKNIRLIYTRERLSERFADLVETAFKETLNK